MFFLSYDFSLGMDEAIVACAQVGAGEHEAVHIGRVAAFHVVAHVAVHASYLAGGVALHIDDYPAVAVGGTANLSGCPIGVIHVEAHLEIVAAALTGETL